MADEEIGAGPPVGEYLKSVRESKGLDLDEASKVTKISRNNLVAIEEGAFDRLPSPAYIKGFLKLYAAYLSLPQDEVVQMYERSRPQAPVQPQQEAKVERARVPVMERSKLGGPGQWVVPAFLLALVIIAAIFFSDGEEKPPTQTPAPQAPAPPPAPTPAPLPAAVQTQRTSASTAAAGVQPAPQAQPNQAAAGQKQPGGMVLKLRFNRDSWLSITIDDSISQRYDLKAGDVIEWKGSKAFILDLGDGGAVEAEFNGKPLKSLGEPGKPAHVELKG